MAKQQQRKDTRFSSVEKRIDMIMALEFLVHKGILNTVMGCHLVSSRLITICFRAVPVNITVVQAYAPTSGYDDNGIGNSVTGYRMSLIRQ